MSEDASCGITLIAFVGSVFSPYYAWARRRGDARAQEHCAINVALYTARGGRWAMTERGARSVHREASQLSVGPSHVRWNGEMLELQIDEICAPWPRRIQGRMRLYPSTWLTRSFALDERARHHWTPFAPRARIDVEFSEPAWRWTGDAYFDSNAGDEPLEAAFIHWSWSRAIDAARSVVLYDVQPRASALGASALGASAWGDSALGEPGLRTLALEFSGDDQVRQIAPPPLAALPPTRWRMRRRTRADANSEVNVVRTLEDAPFYSRSVLDSTVGGTRGAAVHESLDLDRFKSAWVQCLLPFRMPRRR